MTGKTFPEAINACAAYLGMTNGNGHPRGKRDLLVEFCKLKHIEPESLLGVWREAIGSREGEAGLSLFRCSTGPARKSVIRTTR